jgi:hypothetical protein
MAASFTQKNQPREKFPSIEPALKTFARSTLERWIEQRLATSIFGKTTMTKGPFHRTSSKTLARSTLERWIEQRLVTSNHTLHFTANLVDIAVRKINTERGCLHLAAEFVTKSSKINRK